MHHPAEPGRDLDDDRGTHGGRGPAAATPASVSDTAPAPSRWRSSRRIGGLAGWSVTSQAASAASNSIVELGIAVFGGVALLGVWAVRFAVAQTALYLVRAAASEPLLADPQPHDDLSDEPRSGAFLTCVGWMALGFAVLLAATGAVTGLDGLTLLAIAVPIVLVQDALRYLAFWSLRPRIAAMMDLAWLVVSGVGLSLLAWHPTLAVAIGVWAGGAAASAVLGLVVLRPRVLGDAWGWWRSVQALAMATTSDTVMYLASNQWLWFWMAATAGDEALGVYRLATLVANPAMLLFLGAQTLIIPVIARRGALPRREAALLGLLPVVGLMSTAVLGLIVIEFQGVFEISSGQLTAGIWAATAAYVLAGGVAGPMAAVLRGHRLGRRLVVSRAASVAVTLGCALAFVPPWETTGLLLAQAIGMMVFAAGGVGAFLPRKRGHPPGTGTGAPPVATGAEGAANTPPDAG